MITDAMHEFRRAIATEGDTGMLIAADRMDESSLPIEQTFGKLLRRYVEIQTYVRMSQVVPPAWVDELKALNAEFKPSESVVGYGAQYSEQFGPFYLKLAVRMTILAENLDLLETHPVRKLEVTDAEVGNDLALILRNHRMGYIEELSISFRWNSRRQEPEVARAFQNFDGTMMQRVSIRGINNNNMKMIQAIFMANRKIRKGCKLAHFPGNLLATKK